MKIEVQAARVAKHGLSLHDRLVGYLPRYAPTAARARWLLNLHNNVPLLAALSEKLTGFSAQRKLPRWRAPYRGSVECAGPPEATEAVLFVDTFNRYFEPENVEAAIAVLIAGGRRVHLPRAVDGSSRPLCCGRTFLSVGLVDEARREAERCIAALTPFVARGVAVIGLEPSCLLGFRDEIPALLKSDDARRLAGGAWLFEEYIARELGELPLAPIGKRALLHGHCHQKSFAVMDTVEAALRRVPDLTVETVESSCCGMAGAFGYGSDTIDVSRKMGELSLLPAVRKADADTLIVADGTSCRQQIEDGSGRAALHVARVLAMSMEAARPNPARLPAGSGLD
jgi:Fe-S oxidoreductase